ncbi:uncharacterized protein LOC113329632 [Papaver somniferum]|uniref:uncharacterized protein LOC113329632 n=1 Tax=Papaver somniferum TaxID=3469 RepID=UPI000E6FCD8C|nr:uncharacterized protein LOC113329632 [Papaver somniferum]
MAVSVLVLFLSTFTSQLMSLGGSNGLRCRSGMMILLVLKPLRGQLGGHRKRDRSVVSPVTDQRNRRILNLAELTRVKDSKLASNQSTPPPKHQSYSSHKDLVPSKPPKDSNPSLPTPPVFEVEDSPDKLHKDKKEEEKSKKKMYE